MTAIGRQLRTALEREDELLRLRTLLSTLMEAVEPFATYADGLNKRSVVFLDPLEDDDYLHTITTTDGVELELKVGDLRRAGEAYLKAKGE